MPLTHVCRWSNEEKRWVHITIEEACKLYPYTVSASRRAFMCDLCKQYVTLTNGSVYQRYFKHSQTDIIKECKERTTGAPYQASLDPKKRDLPVRIVFDASSFRFEIGFFQIPNQPVDNAGQIIITARGRELGKYNISRLKEVGITYLPIGRKVCSEYSIDVVSSMRGTYMSYWPDNVVGCQDGTIFDKINSNAAEQGQERFLGRKLPEDADVTIDHTYYYLTQYRNPFAGKSFDAKEIASYSVELGSVWRLFEFSATEANKEVAEFFFEHGCRLTDKPSALFPVWPPSIYFPYFSYCNTDRVYCYTDVDEDTQIKTVPYVAIPLRGNLAKIYLNYDTCMVSVGRQKVIRYFYISKSIPEICYQEPSLTVKTASDDILPQGNYHKMPKDRKIEIMSEVDGYYKIFLKGSLVGKRRIISGESILIDNLQMGMEIEIYQGLDLIWKAAFIGQVLQSNPEEHLLNKLDSVKGIRISADHELGYLYRQLKQYPKVQNWLLRRKREGSVEKDALDILRKVIHPK